MEIKRRQKNALRTLISAASLITLSIYQKILQFTHDTSTPQATWPSQCLRLFMEPCFPSVPELSKVTHRRLRRLFPGRAAGISRLVCSYTTHDFSSATSNMAGGKAAMTEMVVSSDIGPEIHNDVGRNDLCCQERAWGAGLRDQ